MLKKYYHFDIKNQKIIIYTKITLSKIIMDLHGLNIKNKSKIREFELCVEEKDVNSSGYAFGTYDNRDTIFIYSNMSMKILFKLLKNRSISELLIVNGNNEEMDFEKT